MPKRKDIQKILIIGSGPIVIGQACEFDYSGAQACKALRAEGYEVVLVNSNPATIMTDPELANRTYIEPLTKEYLEEILVKEKHWNHTIPVSKICAPARDRLTALRLDDIEEVVSLRLTGPQRVWGYRVGPVFHLLWWDPEHHVYQG